MSATDELPHPTRRNWCWLILQFALRMTCVVFLRYRAAGLRNVPSCGGGLYLVNHQSFVDPLLVGLPLQRPVSFLARDNLFRVPVIGWILRNTYVMPINRRSASSASIKAAAARMEHGFAVGIFPEGTRSSSGEMNPFKPGFIALVRRAKVPVYPVGIAGADRAMPRSSLFLHFSQVRVVFGEPISVDDLQQLTVKGQEQAFLQVAEQRVRECQQAAQQWLAGTGLTGE